MHAGKFPLPPSPPPRPRPGWAKPVGIAIAVICGILALNGAVWLCLALPNIAAIGIAAWIAVFGGCTACIMMGLGALALAFRN